jgi:tetratricopeptide (TPR) repeat protein
VGKLVAGLKVLPALLSAQALVKKNPAAALIAAERALNADPSHVGAQRVLAEAAQALDLPETAVFALESVREQLPSHRPTLVRLAQAYIAAGRSQEGLAIAEKLMREAPGDAIVKELIKYASVAQSINAGRWDSDSGSFRDKLRDEGQSVSLEQASKVVRSEDMTLRQLDEAVSRVHLEPANQNHYRTIVQAYRTLGRLDDALEWLARARALPTGAADVSLEKLESELRVMRAENRVRDRAAAIAAAGGDAAIDPELRRLRREHTEMRVHEIRAFAEKYPNDHNYKFELGQLYRELGQLDLAIQQFQVVQRTPKLRLGALMNLGACFRTKGLFDLAVQQFETAKAEIAAFDEHKKEAIYELGCCFEAMGRGERAVEEFKLIYSSDIGFRDVAAKIDRFYAKSQSGPA